MFQQQKAKADVGAPTHSISRITWRHKLALVAVTASLAQVGYSDWNCGNYIWYTNPSSICLNSILTNPNGTPINGSVQTIYPSYNACGDFYAGTHTACISTRIRLDGATYRYAARGCNTAVASRTPLSLYRYDAAITYTCGGTVPTPPRQAE